jgi:hypothetical protein
MKFFQNRRNQFFRRPAGTNENSPQFQLRENEPKKSSPAGTAEKSFDNFSRLFEALPLFNFIPQLKLRAIFNRHSVTPQCGFIF